ncbi:hypothetical protein KY334_08220 [Candidatus Woesearchaeota archaeon]|nr:hypothetical protein [Candidatus Woesearchaeota archaeon]
MYTAEDYISFIEQGRYDRISNFALKEIAQKFRELQQNESYSLGDGDYNLFTDGYNEYTEYHLILLNPGISKLQTVKKN